MIDGISKSTYMFHKEFYTDQIHKRQPLNQRGTMTSDLKGHSGDLTMYWGVPNNFSIDN